MKCKECGQEKPAETFKAGDIVEFKEGLHREQKRLFVVVHSYVADAHQQKWGHIRSEDVAIVGLHDGNAYSPGAKYIQHVHGYHHVYRTAIYGGAGSEVTKF